MCRRPREEASTADPHDQRSNGHGGSRTSDRTTRPDRLRKPDDEGWSWAGWPIRRLDPSNKISIHALHIARRQQPIRWGRSMATINLTSNVIAENLAGPFRVGTLGIQDRPGEPFTFTLADHPVFEIVTADENGHAVYDLFVKSGVTFDYEAEPRRFDFSIEVRDGIGDPVEVDPVSIDVTNVNDAPTDIAMAGGSVPDNADL